MIYCCLLDTVNPCFSYGHPETKWYPPYQKSHHLQGKRILIICGQDLQNIGKWLREHNVKTVAMESTGVYWIPLFEELERQGFECLLISSRLLRRVPGRKSNIQDAQWIQTLHSYGLLESSFRPQGELVALGTLLRHRSQLVEHRSTHIQHMQKALLQTCTEPVKV